MTQANAMRRVLIVEDDGDFAESVVDILEPRGFQTVVVGSSEAAIAAVHSPSKSEVPSVALIAVQLGSASGIDLLVRLRSERPDLIGVLMTAELDTHTAI